MSENLKKEILKPKNKDELVQFIKDEIKENDNNCDLNHIDTSLIIDMSYLFTKNNSLGGYDLHEFNGDISKWNTQNVQNMNSMFKDSLFNQDISTWNTSNVINMSSMFYNSQFNQDISQWNTSSVTNMSFMFEFSKFNKDINQWNTENVTDMSAMFSYSKFNQNISSWNISNVQFIARMFSDSLFNQDISKWNTSSVKYMSNMFSNSQFNQDISQWDIVNLTDISYMFSNSKITKIPQWNYFKIDNLESCFDNCFELIESLPDWYQFNHIINAQDRQKNYDNYLKSKKLNNFISNNLNNKSKKSINKI